MKTSSIIVVLFMAGFGSFIGFGGGATADVPPVMVLPEMAKPFLAPLNVRLDLETGQMEVENAANGAVNLQIEHKVVETPPEYITRREIVEVEREVYLDNIVKASRLLNRIAPLGKPESILSSIGDREEQTLKR